MELTRDAVEYHATTADAARRSSRMSTARHRTRPDARARRRVTQRGSLRSEWIKLRSLRSTLVAADRRGRPMVGLGVLVGVGHREQLEHDSTPASAPTFDAIDAALGGYHLAQLAIGVVGVLVISGEYSTGMIRVDARGGAAAAAGAVGQGRRLRRGDVVLMLAATFVASSSCQAIVAGHGTRSSLGDPRVLRAVLGTAAVPDRGRRARRRRSARCCATPPAAISVFVGLLIVLPGLSVRCPRHRGRHACRTCRERGHAPSPRARTSAVLASSRPGAASPCSGLRRGRARRRGGAARPP